MESLIAGDTEPKADSTISSMIAQGESERVEFRSSLRWDYKANAKNKGLELVIAKAIAGFMNAAGGTLLIGVGPDKEVLGLQNDYNTFTDEPNRDGFEPHVTHVVSKYLGKEYAALVHISFADCDGRDICRIQADSSPKPAYLEENGDFRFYVRLGNTTQP